VSPSLSSFISSSDLNEQQTQQVSKYTSIENNMKQNNHSFSSENSTTITTTTTTNTNTTNITNTPITTITTISPLLNIDQRHFEGKRTSEMNLVTQDFIDAQRDFIPASLKGIKLYKSNVTWDDIGGFSFIFYYLSFPSHFSFQ
jgi:SpoVK/Ycf46/Vps4 family AAA+-type ATPase